MYICTYVHMYVRMYIDIFFHMCLFKHNLCIYVCTSIHSYIMSDDALNVFNAFITGTTPVVPLYEQKRYIVDKINVLPVVDKKDIAEAIILADYKHVLKECSEGLIVNLDNLSENVINQIFELIKYKLGHRK